MYNRGDQEAIMGISGQLLTGDKRHRRWHCCRLFLCVPILLAWPKVSFAGNIYLTGHDYDYHCTSGGGQCNAIGAAADFVRKCAPDPTKPVLIVDNPPNQVSTALA